MPGYLQERLHISAALSGKLSQSRINALDGAISINHRAPVLHDPKLIVKIVTGRNTSAEGKGQKAAIAEKALGSFLDPEAKFGAVSLKKTLEAFAEYITDSLPFARWIPGPLKTIEKAMGKTVTDYSNLWHNNKDLVRGTLACENQGELSQIAALVTKTCVAEYAMSLIKREEQKSIRDGGYMDAGYSGWNLVVDFKEHRFGAEVQANTFSMMYGKMSKPQFCNDLRFDAAQYEDRRRKAMFPGGLSHALYDIQDKRFDASTEDKSKALALALDYNDLCRNMARKPNIDDLNSRIRSMRFTSAEAIKHWQHAVDGSGGLM
jgi:hypothetical protein